MTKVKTITLAPAILCTIIVVAHISAVILPGDFDSLGIQARSIRGLSGIIFSPFIHSGFAHLIANIVPLFIMGCFVSALDPKVYVFRTAVLVILSGLLTWLISSSGNVIGASGLVFAYWSFLITYGLRQKTLKSVAIAIGTILLYGTLIISLFKYIPGISWAGHISGVLTGVILAILLSTKK